MLVLSSGVTLVREFQALEMPYVLLVEIDGWVFLGYSGHPLGKFGGICSCAAVLELTLQLLPRGLTSVWGPGFLDLMFFPFGLNPSWSSGTFFSTSLGMGTFLNPCVSELFLFCMST